jgi:hypothetical protein
LLNTTEIYYFSIAEIVLFHKKRPYSPRFSIFSTKINIKARARKMPSPLDTVSVPELLKIAKIMSDAVNANPADYSLTAGQAAELDAKLAAAQASYSAHIAARTAARAAKTAKDADRRELVRTMRRLRNLAKASGTPAAKMTGMGIPRSPEAAPNATSPMAIVDTSKRLRHSINWSDASAPGVKRKPRGTIGVEIWMKVGGDEPVGGEDCIFFTTATKTPTLVEHQSPDAGKPAHYKLRWRFRNGEASSWSETVSATITG